MSATGRSAGFTLIEMLVVLAIAGLIAGVGWPRLERSLARAEASRAATGVAAALRGARAAAIRRQAMVMVRVDPDGAVLRADAAPPLAMPRGVALAASGPVAFYGDGSASGGELRVAAGSREWRYAIRPGTGAVAGTAR